MAKCAKCAKKAALKAKRLQAKYIAKKNAKQTPPPKN